MFKRIRTKKPIHYRSWKSICKPKKEGGLGIRNLELVNKGTGPDILCWKLNSNGQCTPKSAYKMLALEEARNSPPINIPMQVLQILRQVWADKTIQPRVKTFAWRLLRLALGTTSRLHRIIPRINEDCSCCGCKEDETHLFF